MAQFLVHTRHLINIGRMNSLKELKPHLRPNMFASKKKYSHWWHHKQIEVRWHAWNVLSWQKEFMPNVGFVWIYLGSGVFYITPNENECLKWASAREDQCRSHTKNTQTSSLMKATFATPFWPEMFILEAEEEKFYGPDILDMTLSLGLW